MTSVTVDFGDGTAISYVNISSIDDGVKHIYSKVGIYQVSATASNNLGSDRVILYLHVSCKYCRAVQEFLSLKKKLFITIQNCVFWPSKCLKLLHFMQIFIV